MLSVHGDRRVGKYGLIKCAFRENSRVTPRALALLLNLLFIRARTDPFVFRAISICAFINVVNPTPPVLFTSGNELKDLESRRFSSGVRRGRYHNNSLTTTNKRTHCVRSLFIMHGEHCNVCPGLSRLRSAVLRDALKTRPNRICIGLTIFPFDRRYTLPVLCRDEFGSRKT